MADIDPYGQIQQLTPRPTSIVDAISETKRITEAIMRSNPLRNARVDDGLMVWRGNYAGGGQVSDSYLWIGEFSPSDASLGKAQRGFLLTRDDPKHARALWMYDPYADTASGSQSLRQTLTMHDADDKPILREARAGGVQFPWSPIPLYPTQSLFITVATSGSTTESMPIIPAASATDGATKTLYRGYGPMTGHRLRGMINVATTVNPTVGVKLFISFNNAAGTTRTTVEQFVGPSSNVFLNFDEDFAGLGVVGSEVQVQVQVRLTAGTFKWSFVFPMLCWSYGQ